ncbi:TetR/AcrR family transcriptional regulator [Halobacillus litoralis]|uniref:TetR family transcriptional regulator n=1 Tax=Halobacillus litoralis TaxID=45668 RepID=A0A410MEQ2_9BACI|nr:TetR/AcrR family transcriptional regulator [Halobacillus litoralis]QAS53193.1 TetR family transcriptional regulator [Halobacillus litoralis]
MDQKSIYIIEQSIKLFAKKGFSSTSVQEIAKECGISKGAFYLHFKTKDALLFEIFNYYYNRIQTKIEEIQNLDVDARTKFTKQLQVTFEELADHREFIIMQIREQAIPFNENIDGFLKQMRLNSYLFYKKHLLNIYGSHVEETIWEVSFLLQGIFKGYMDLIIIEGADLNFEVLSKAVLRRTDFIIEGFEQSGDQPVINDEFIQKIIPEALEGHGKDLLLSKLQEIRADDDQEVQDTVAVLLEEMNRESPRTAILKGMLTNLEKNKHYEGFVSEVRSFYQL